VVDAVMEQWPQFWKAAKNYARESTASYEEMGLRGADGVLIPSPQ
jgi:hypothetical protein